MMHYTSGKNGASGARLEYTTCAPHDLGMQSCLQQCAVQLTRTLPRSSGTQLTALLCALCKRKRHLHYSVTRAES